MRITIRNKNACLICDRNIICFEGYKCYNCGNNFHKRCILDANPVNNINNIKCIVCLRYINFQNSLTYDIIKCILLEFIPSVLCISIIIGIFVFFIIPK